MIPIPPFLKILSSSLCPQTHQHPHWQNRCWEGSPEAPDPERGSHLGDEGNASLTHPQLQGLTSAAATSSCNPGSAFPSPCQDSSPPHNPVPGLLLPRLQELLLLLPASPPIPCSSQRPFRRNVPGPATSLPLSPPVLATLRSRWFPPLPDPPQGSPPRVPQPRALGAATPGPALLTGAILDLVRVEPHAVAGVEQLQHRAAGHSARRRFPAAAAPAQQRQQQQQQQRRMFRLPRSPRGEPRGRGQLPPGRR